MSNLDLKPSPTQCGAEDQPGPVRELLRGRRVPLGESTVVRRLLPSLGRRMIGAWCFVDHYRETHSGAHTGTTSVVSEVNSTHLITVARSTRLLVTAIVSHSTSRPSTVSR